MNERDHYYSYYEKLMRMAPQMGIEQRPEYQALAERYPYLSKSLKLRKELERLNEELRLTKPGHETSTRLRVRSEIRNHATELKRLEILERLHGESKWERSYRRRFVLAAIAKTVRSRFEELSQSLRFPVASKLPPSLVDVRSLDSADRDLALREWTKRRGMKIEWQRNPLWEQASAKRKNKQSHT